MDEATTIDAVDMMHEGARRVSKLLEGMSRQEELKFWHEKHLELVELQKRLREARAAEMATRPARPARSSTPSR